MEQDIAVSRLIDLGQKPGDGAFAAAAFPHDGDDFARADGEIEVIHRMQLGMAEEAADAEMPGEPDGLQQGRRYRR